MTNLKVLALILATVTAVTHAAFYEPIREVVTLDSDTLYRSRKIFANTDTNIFLQNIQCRLLDVDKVANGTTVSVYFNWVLHYVPCGVNFDTPTWDQIANPCLNSSQTQWIKTEEKQLQCTAEGWKPGPSFLFNEQLTQPTSFDSCLNTSLQTHRHIANGTSGVVARTWTSGTFVLFLQSAIDAKNSDKTAKWQISMQFQVRSAGGGYLPAPTQPLLYFWATMMGVNSIVVIAWLILCGKDWRGVVRLHSFITLAIFSAFLEAAFSLTVAYGVNKTGYPRVQWNIAAEIAQAMKATTLRILLIVISMGYGSTKANRFRNSIYKPLGVFAAFYFVAILVPEIMRAVKPFNVRANMYARIPAIFAHTFSIAWIIISMFKTAKILRKHGDFKKLNVYNILVGVMTLCFVASVTYVAVRIYSVINNDCELWRIRWLDEAFWVLVAFFITLAICILWRPSQTMLVWAYSNLVNDEDETFSRLGGEQMSVDSRL